MRLTAAQALVRFLAVQVVERDGERRRFFGGCFGVFGHGNVAGVGQALFERPDLLTYIPARNEQAMVHAATGYARQMNRLGAFVCTTSIGPGATNMVTGAALATVNRLPVLLLPGDVFASRVPDPVLQQLEPGSRGDVSVNDCFRPVSRYFDRIERPEQVIPAALAAMRVLTNQAETGAVTLAFPQDVQAEAYDLPDEFLARARLARAPRRCPTTLRSRAAATAIRAAERPLVVAGGGVVYSEATDALRRLCEQTGIPVGETQAGKGSLPYDHPSCARRDRRDRHVRGQPDRRGGRHRARDRDALRRLHDRFEDRLPEPRRPLRERQRRGLRRGEARRHLRSSATRGRRWSRLSELLAGHAVAGDVPRDGRPAERASGTPRSTRLYAIDQDPLPRRARSSEPSTRRAGPADVVVCAAGSMPGDLHKLWRTRDPKGYHVEYGYSCMGYEIAGGLGAKLAAPEREVYVLVGDGSYLMLSSELVTSLQEGVKLTIVLVDNHGYNSIGALSRSLGTDGFGTQLPLPARRLARRRLGRRARATTFPSTSPRTPSRSAPASSAQERSWSCALRSRLRRPRRARP